MTVTFYVRNFDRNFFCSLENLILHTKTPLKDLHYFTVMVVFCLPYGMTVNCIPWAPLRVRVNLLK